MSIALMNIATQMTARPHHRVSGAASRAEGAGAKWMKCGTSIAAYLASGRSRAHATAFANSAPRPLRSPANFTKAAPHAAASARHAAPTTASSRASGAPPSAQSAARRRRRRELCDRERQVRRTRETGAEALLGELAGARARRLGVGVGREHESLAPVRARAGGPAASSTNPRDSGATDSVDAAASAADSAATEPA
jgi:hypothetical protein